MTLLTDTVHIREAFANESDLIALFQIKMALETENLALGEAVIKKGVEAVFADPRKGQYYMAMAGEAVIGCMLNTYEWSDWRNGTFVWFQSVWVEPEWRNKGVFRGMYQHIKHLVEQNENLKGLRLYVFHTNKKAHKVYRSLGMDDECYQMFEWVKPNI